MRNIAVSDIQNLHEYEAGREGFRSRVIERKARRRISIGPLVTLVFENRETVLFQIQEMLRVERIVDPEKVRHEVEVYNALIPGPGEVSATLFIEVTDPADVKPVLDSFIGLDAGKSLWLEAGGKKFYAKFEEGHGREDKISAVHYVRFDLGSAGASLLAEGPAALAISHGSYRARTPLTPETTAELRADLSAD